MKFLSAVVFTFIIFLDGCSLITVSIENQATSRSISEAKKNPTEVENSKQDSTRNRERKKNLDVSASM